MKNKFNDVDNATMNLDTEENLDIASIENILVNNIENYKNELHKHVEELLKDKIDENKIIIKKNENGKKKDTAFVIKVKKD